MKISVLGSNGFLSNAIGKYANEYGWHLDVYGLTKPEGLHYHAFYEINLMDKNLDCASMRNSDIIIYAIGAGIQSNLNECADLIYALNVTAPVNICNKLKALEYKGTFVTFGSYFEVGETDLQRPATEQDIINANAPAPTDYVVSKRMLTKFVTSYKHDFTHWHLILPTIYGPGENPQRLIPYTINAICKGEKPCFTRGNQVRQYLYVGDVALVIDKGYKVTMPSGIYNIAGPDTLTVRQLIDVVAKEFQYEFPDDCYGSASRKDVAMNYLALDDSVISKTIGGCGKAHIEEMLKGYLR